MNKINTAKVYEIREHHDYLKTLTQDVTDKNEGIAVVRGDVEDKRENLLEARKDRKILENLKEKRIAEAREEAVRKEQARIDELANRKRNST
jgi:flagellar FliJ protein